MVKIVKQKITECKFHNKLLTVVEQHIIACFQNAFFGLDKCNKVNSPLVNCLISDTLLDAKPRFNQ